MLELRPGLPLYGPTIARRCGAASISALAVVLGALLAFPRGADGLPIPVSPRINSAATVGSKKASGITADAGESAANKPGVAGNVTLAASGAATKAAPSKPARNGKKAPTSKAVR